MIQVPNGKVFNIRVVPLDLSFPKVIIHSFWTKFEGSVHGLNRVVSVGKNHASNIQIYLPCNPSFTQTSFQLIVDLVELLHGPAHAHASMYIALPILEVFSSVQITLIFCCK
jgi:hypothetical protein